ncbi:MAG: helix-turn-helix transcriptional regulator [Sphingomonadales bacterium]|nr:helix-turn-helix transcriptional regulator [Sphingomonadales bacterium]
MPGLQSDAAFIRALCSWARLAPSALAREAGLTPTTVLRPYNGVATSRLSQPTFEKLRQRFADFPGWRQEAPDLPGLAGSRPAGDTGSGELAYVRALDISLGMGAPGEVEEFPTAELVPFSLGFLSSLTRATSERLLILTGHGESMEPTLLRGDMLLIDTSQREPRVADQIWAFHYAGGGMVKRLRQVREGDAPHWLILSDNRAIPAQSAACADVHVLGRLLWIGRCM